MERAATQEVRHGPAIDACSSSRLREASTMSARFLDRHDAGRQLASRLLEYAGQPDVLVLALPRGGVPVAFEVAQALDAPMDVFLVRKLGLPSHPEFAMGAIATGGVRVLDDEVIRASGVTRGEIEEVTARERRELERRDRDYRGDRPPPAIEGKTAILVDDGLATGASMRAAVEALRAERPARAVVAVPVAPEETCEMLRGEADDVVCAATPEPFYAVGLWYEDFEQTTDAEVRELLARAAHEPDDAHQR
jgi:predicted phosphoribosyltransferase